MNHSNDNNIKDQQLLGMGPDIILPATSYTTSDRQGSVRLAYDPSEPRDQIEPISIVTQFRQTAEKFASHTALAVKRPVNVRSAEANNATGQPVHFSSRKEWIKWTYSEYVDEVTAVACAFIHLGLEARGAVAISGFNAPEWAISAMATIFADGMTCGLYPTNGLDTNVFVINDSKSNIVVSDNLSLLKGLSQNRSSVPHIKAMVFWEDCTTKESQVEEARKIDGVILWHDMIKMGKAGNLFNQALLSEMLDRQSNMAINQCAMLIYTSGTTGNPKGVMLSHDNLMFDTRVAVKKMKLGMGVERVLSYLPLSHIAGTIVDIVMPLCTAASAYFADKSALKGSIVQYMNEVQPTLFFGVPRVYEKLMEGIIAKGKAASPAKKKMASIFKTAAIEYHLSGKKKKSGAYNLGQKLFYPKVREALGLSQCNLFATGAAPISMETILYFASLNIPLQECYGMSETCSLHHMVFNMDSSNIGSVGPSACPGMRTIINDTTDGTDGNGEIWMFGRNIMMGYLGLDNKTREEMIDDPEMCDGYGAGMKSGDIGMIDKSGNLRITGRIKELIITAGGENVAPVPIEERIKQELPLLSNVVVLGDRKKYLSAILTIRTERNMKTGEFIDNLDGQALEFVEKLNTSRPIKTVSQILQNVEPALMAAIQSGIDKANALSVSNAQRVQKWMILPTDLSESQGVLGPTLKLKRFAFYKRFEHQIERLYV